MLTGLDRNEVKEYVSEVEKGSDNPTVFVIGVMSGKDRLVHAANFENINDPSGYYDLVKKGLKEIRNIKTKSGEVKNITVIDDAALDLLPTAIVKELFVKIIEFNYLSGAEAKN